MELFNQDELFCINESKFIAQLRAPVWNHYFNWVEVRLCLVPIELQCCESVKDATTQQYIKN